MSEVMQRIYVTKYALSEGLQEHDVEPRDDGYRYCRVNGWSQQFPKGTWFLTRAEAIADAQLRRDAKIVSLKKQIAKLEKKTFA